MEKLIWDKFVRSFHWLTASLFLLNYWLLEAGEAPHEWVGYSIAALVSLRIVWGFIGSRHAQFADFFPTPSRLRTYLRAFPQSHRDYPGHNPLGGLMILFLLMLLLLTAISGWLQTTDAFWGEEWVELLHAYSANILMGAVVIHVAAVIGMQRLTGTPLIKTMLTGRRPS